MLFLSDERLWIEAQFLPEGSEEFRRTVETDWRLEPRFLQCLAQSRTKFTVHANVCCGVSELGNLCEITTQRECHIYSGTNTLNEPSNFCEVGGGVEVAISGTDDIHQRCTVLALSFFIFLGAVLLPQPNQSPICALPLIFINGPRQEAFDVGVLRGYASTNHLGDGACNHHTGLLWIEGLMGSTQGAFRSSLPQFFFSKAGDNDW